MPHADATSLWSPHVQHWRLDRSITFLNHGSFGACPSRVLDYQSQLRDQMEAEPVRFFTREMQPLLDASREALAELVGSDANDLAFIPNATTAVNAVLRSIDWQRGDELLLTDHAYNACSNVVDFLRDRTGVKPVVVPLPFSVSHADKVTALILSGASSHTRLAMIDHVTSSTGLVLPIADIVRQLAERGIDTLVDGAHAPGMLALDLRSLQAAYYTGNCHKWLCAPKGAAFLHVHRDRQCHIAPATISHGWNSPRKGRSRFHDLFDWPGTVDPTPWLCVGEAIAFLNDARPDGIAGVMAHNRANTLQGRAVLLDRLQLAPPCPDDMIGSLAAVPLPPASSDHPPVMDDRTVPTPSHPLHTRLLEEFRIEAPIFFWPAFPHALLRIAMQLYNTVAQIEHLADVLAFIRDEQPVRH